MRNGDPYNENYLTAAGAEFLAAQLREYWRKRGYTVATFIEPRNSKGGPAYEVRTDLRGGLPQDFHPADTRKIRRDLRARWETAAI